MDRPARAANANCTQNGGIALARLSRSHGQQPRALGNARCQASFAGPRVGAVRALFATALPRFTATLHAVLARRWASLSPVIINALNACRLSTYGARQMSNAAVAPRTA